MNNDNFTFIRSSQWGVGYITAPALYVPILESLASSLPHGSGIDLDWQVNVLKNGLIVCSNSYHLINEYGMYIVWVDFKVTINPNSLTDFTLTFQNNHYYVERNGLRDYLEDTIAYCLSEFEKKQED